MGRFSTTLNIKNNSDRKGFLKSFCEMMKKRGFVKCNEDEAAVSYALAFGKGWVTLANEDYKDNTEAAYDDRKLISEEMKTAAFTVEVVDSDFAILCLNSSGRTSKIVVGDGEGYGVEKAPFEVDDWKPLIKNGDCEKFLDTVGQDDVFAEETLSVIAELLGIDPYYIDADYDEILEKSDDVLYFTKAAEKPLTLRTAFVKVFGEGLEPLGYKRLKKLDNKYPFFVRVVNGDILHVVSYRQTTSPKIGYKEFSVYSGVITLYRREIDFTVEPHSILTNIYHLYKDGVDSGKIDPSVNQPSAFYLCNANDRGEMLRTLEQVFNNTMGILELAINKMTDLKTCIEYFKAYKGMQLYPLDEFITSKYTGWSEALLLVKTRDMDDSLIRIKKGYDDYDFKFFLGKNPKKEDMDRFLKKKNDEREAQYNLRMEMINNPELNKRVLDEMERCKANNIELLKSYGLFDEPKPQKPAKPLSLNAAFKKVFDAALEPLGYKLIKSKHPYYVRAVSDEIIHVISYYNAKHYPNENNIAIKGGVATVYRQKIDFSRTPGDENWLTNNCDIYINRLRHGLEELDEELKHNLYYHASKPEDILDEMEYQLSLTKRFLLPALDKAMTIESCIENDFELNIDLNIYDDGSFGTKYGDGYYNESILYFKTDRSVYENIIKNATGKAALSKEDYFERVQDDPDLYKEVQEELERRKAQNTEILRSYGVDI